MDINIGKCTRIYPSPPEVVALPVRSDVLSYDESLQGEAVAIYASVWHDSTHSATIRASLDLIDLAERWARWHGGEWVAGPVLIIGRVEPGQGGGWKSWLETLAIPMRRIDGSGLETVDDLIAA